VQADLVRQIGAWGSTARRCQTPGTAGSETPGRCCDRSPCGPEPTPRLGVGSQAKPVLGNFWRIGRTVRRDAVIPGRLQHVGAFAALHPRGSAGENCGGSADGIPQFFSSGPLRCRIPAVASTHVLGPISRDAGLLPRHVGVGAQAGRRDRGEVMPALVEGTTPPSRVTARCMVTTARRADSRVLGASPPPGAHSSRMGGADVGPDPSVAGPS
jgi:hypothetical protein